MSEELVFGEEPGPERPVIEVDSPVNIRPKLGDIGIEEVERGVCQDTFENRALLRAHKMGWDPVYASNGVPTWLIQARPLCNAVGTTAGYRLPDCRAA